MAGGQGNNVSGADAAIVGGYYNTVSGFRSFIGGGSANVVSGRYSLVAGGTDNQATGLNTCVAGSSANSATGNYSFVGGGLYNTAQSYGESVLGLNATVGAGSANSYISTDRLFVVGNGTADASRSNALTILKNANATVGGSLTINGNGTNSSITLPTGRGTAGQFLKINADGTTQWANTPEPGTAPSQMQYWNGTAWVTVAAGAYGQVLEFRDGAPTWVDKNINTLLIGDTYQGGIIAYFLQSGDPGYDANVRHGLIAAPSDQSTGIQWGSNITTGATFTAIGAGNTNTNIIVTSQGAGSYAAKLCSDLVFGGYSDWYLPSKDELGKLYANRTAVGGFASAWYWSSSEFQYNYAWRQWFNTGDQTNTLKSGASYVRAVRSF